MTLRYAPAFILLFSAGCARQKFFQPDALFDATPLAATADSARVTAGRHYHRGLFGRLLLGRHHRPAWTEPVTLPVFDPATTVAGGLQPGKIGGGFQTTSMTVTNTEGQSYALRTIDKNPYRTLPKVLRHTFVLNLVRDATSAGHPYGAFVVPVLAEAAGVLHTSPKAFYVRADEIRLGPASELYQGRVVMLEEKLEGQANIAGRLPAGATKLEESDKPLEERYESGDHTLDEPAFLRARLLDLLLGDWDRHEGQWTWAAYPQGKGQIRWTPIPQDRDQVFFRFDDGLIPWVASKVVRKFRTFGPRYQSIEGYTRNARYLDEHVLTELDRAAYLATAHDLQSRLTDAIIEKAVRQGLPQQVYEKEGAEMATALRARRDALPEAAAEFYRLRAHTVLVAGTDEEERFVVERLNDTATVVSVYRLRDGKAAARPDSLLYRRRFNPTETHTINLYGLQGDDVFEVRGSVHRSPFVNIYGGPHEDEVTDQSHVAGLRRKTRFYDTARNNKFEPAPELKDKTSHGVTSHAFDRDGSGR